MPEHPQFYGKHLRYMGMAQIIMQENYIAMFNAPQAAQAEPVPPEQHPAGKRQAGLGQTLHPLYKIGSLLQCGLVWYTGRNNWRANEGAKK